MNALRWIRRSLWFHRRVHAGTVLGTCAAAAAIAGALLAGDAAKRSLRNSAENRLGNVQIALQTGRRLVRHTMAEELARQTGGQFAPVLALRATAASASVQPLAIQLIGAEKRFWGFARPGRVTHPHGDGAWLSPRAARRLGTKPGEWITLRLVREGGIAAEAPFAPTATGAEPARIVVAGIVPRDALGEFSLEHGASPPDNVFVPLTWLQEHFGLSGRVNLLLGNGCEATAANAALRRSWRIEDAGLELRPVPATGELELRSREVFIPPPIAEAVMRAVPQGRGVLTYVVNEIACGERSAPYSVVAAMPPHVEGPVAAGMPPNSIVLNDWLATDIGARSGDTITLRYFAPGDGRRLIERATTFRVAAIVPISGRANDPTLMPDFPGLAGASDCRKWDPGFKVDLSKIRDKDEAYWDEHRGTPKAFITLREGEALWANRFGSMTAIRFPATDANSLAASLARAIDPGSLGVAFRDARAEALRAAEGSVDFGGLFVGFNMFLIASALLLTALLFAFTVESRRPEAGALLAMGWRRTAATRLLIMEGAALAVMGMLPGVLLGIAYMALAIGALNHIWLSTSGSAPLGMHVSISAAAAGAIIGVLLSCATIAWTARGRLRGPIRALLAGEDPDAGTARFGRGRAGWIVVSILGVGAAVAMFLGPQPTGGEAQAMRFFGAGAAMLLATVGAAAAWLRHSAIAAPKSPANFSPRQLAWLGVARRPGRSTATVALLACGIFMVASAGAHRRDPLSGADRRDSGTGGFALLAKGPVALANDPRDRAAMADLGLSAKTAAQVHAVPGRVRDGDDASCLNPTKAQTPRLLGIDPGELRSRGAFRITRAIPGVKVADGWGLLDTDLGSDVVPALADESTAVWALGLGIGARLPMADGRGHRFEVEIVGLLAPSILQGWLVISDRNFLDRYPDASGYRLLLIDAPPDRRDAAQLEIGRALADMGWEVRPAVARLADLMAVEHTYLAIFQVAGGLGVLLGAAGLGTVLLRNVLERRRELAMLRAIGFSTDGVRRLVLREHILILALGTACGIVPAVLATWPAIRATGGTLPLLGLTCTLAGVIAAGALSVHAATRRALAGNLVAALRDE
ncbi:MAG TPA: ABC transporter permease [Verrucomicrobiae bacterium]|nr:ABC transporter permease [Verrucomicrobiae bacterium]